MAGQKGNTGYITDLIDVTRKEGDTPKSWFEREFGIFKKEVDGLDMNNIPPKQREFISGKIDNFDENFIGKVQRILGGIR
jgi:hypothetical protein